MLTQALYLSKLSIIIDGETKKRKFKQYLFTNAALQRILEENSKARRIAMPKKTQDINHLTTNPKEEKHMHT